MSDFDWVDFNRLVVELELWPLTATEARIVRELCDNKPLRMTRDNVAALDRLSDLGLVGGADDFADELADDDEIFASHFLLNIRDRGYLSQLSKDL